MTSREEGMQKERMVELMGKLAVNEGFSPSEIKAVRFIRMNQPVARVPVIYEPSIVIVGQGKKIGYLGDQVYPFDPFNCLVLSVPLPFECETRCTPEEPYLAMSVRVDPTMVAELLFEMDDDHGAGMDMPRGICTTPLTPEMIGATVRLLECLVSPLDSRIFGPQNMRDIIHLLLYGERGEALRALADKNSRFSLIAGVLRRIHTEYAEGLDMELLAGEANMSVSTFHHSFKAVTSSSPLQYLENIRLHKARILMAQDGLDADGAAGKVGYASASQFSREFKRYFGASPAEEAARLRESGLL
jgi:AraC-like DNA-binding protein